MGNDPVNKIDPTGKQTCGTTDCDNPPPPPPIPCPCDIPGIIHEGLVGLGEKLRDSMQSENAESEGKSSETPEAVDTSEAAEEQSKRFSEEKQALVEMAKGDAETGMSEADMEAYKDLNKGLPDPFPENRVRGPEVHPNRPIGKYPHGHVGPVNHIPIK